MAETQALNATFFAFKKRERQGVLAGATLAFVVLFIVLVGGFLALNFQLIGMFVSWWTSAMNAAATGGAPPDMSNLPAGLGVFFLTAFLAMIAGYILTAAYEAACLRWMIRGETSGFFGLTLGADTWRVYLTYWIWFALSIAYSMISGLIANIFLFAGMAAGAGDDIAVMGPAFALYALVRLLLLVPLVYFAVRFAPAAATSVGLKRFAFFDSWTVTKGRFWALFGAFFVLYLIFFIVEVVLLGGAFVAVFAGAAMSLPSLADAQQAEAFLAALLTPQTLVIAGAAYAVLTLFSLWLYVAFYGVNARAVIAAAEDGKIQGVASIGLEKAFE